MRAAGGLFAHVAFTILGLLDGLKYLKLICVFDPHLDPGARREGYLLDHIALPGIGSMDMTLSFPPEWRFSYCCHRLQVRFNGSLLLEPYFEEDYFIPIAEWSLCSPDIAHVTCYGSREGDGEWESSLRRGSWWVTLQQCLMPEADQVKYELSTFGDLGLAQPSAPRYTGNVSITQLNSEEARVSKGGVKGSSKASSCIIEGNIVTAQSWYGYLETVLVSPETSLFYRFSFKLNEPSNEEIYTVFFYSEDDLSTLFDTMHCDNNSLKVYRPALDAQQELSLSINNAWSGCSIENVDGTPTYICESGRNFARPKNLHIAVSNCRNRRGIHLNYTLEFLNPARGCPKSATYQLYSSLATQWKYHTPLLAGSLCLLIALIDLS